MISIVTYASSDQVVLDGCTGDEAETIQAAIEDLAAGGSTAGSRGITTAYALAEEHFIPGGNNRVILATDGDLNVGVTSEGELVRLIEGKKESGVFLSVMGFGTGNLKDNKMEALARPTVTATTPTSTARWRPSGYWWRRWAAPSLPWPRT